MKKTVAVLLALLLALTCTFAMAEGSVLEMGLDYDITIDVPAGYTMSRIPSAAMIMASFVPEDASAAEYTLTIVYSEEFGDYILNDLSPEEFEQMSSILTADFADPVITLPTTQVGTKLIQVDEQGSESEYGVVLTIYHGYFIQITLEKPDGVQLTESDFQTAIDLMSSLQLVDLSK